MHHKDKNGAPAPIAPDPGLAKFPAANDVTWMASMDVANEVYNGTGLDVSGGSTHYYDRSLDGTENVPAWAKDGSMVHVMDSGNFHFWKKAA